LPDWFPFAGKRSKAPVAPPVEPTIEAPAPTAPQEPVADTRELQEAKLTEPPVSKRPTDEQSEPELEAGTTSESEQEPGAEEGAKPKRRRRRRGRRRGSAARTEEPETVEEEAAEAVEESVEAFSSPGDSLDNVSDDEEEDDGDDEQGGSRTPKHRSVPSWGDAIGVVVDANIAARSERKKFGNRSSGGGSGGRGRRGGRRRGTPS
jgi:hypothetical protein